MNGEPFVTKELPDYIKQAKKIGYQYVYITTNGSLVTEEKIKACAEAGIDSIKFSINAGSRETYKIVHQKDDYNKVIQNLKDTYRFRQEQGYSFKILSSFVVTKYTVQEIKEHYKNIKPYVDELVFFNVESFAGQMEDEVTALRAEIEGNLPKHKIANQAPCKALWNSINVTCEGFLTLCCSEAFNYLAAEDLNQMGLKEAWYSERMIAIRKRHIENKLEETQCGKCLGSWAGKVNPLNQELFNRSQGA